MKKALVICGLTSSGKTSLALSVANNLGQPTNIISADSRQVYKELDIVSGKDIPSDMPPGINLLGTDIFKPDEVSNLSDYVSKARSYIEESIKDNRFVIIVGGTGLYLKGITSNLSNLSIPFNQNLRNKLQHLSVNELQQTLKDTDIIQFNKLNNSDVNNPRRLIRYIEIASNSQDARPLTPLPKVNFLWVGLKVSPVILESRILQRVKDRLDQGAVYEVETLLKKYPDTTLPVYSTLGVAEILRYLDKKISKEDLILQWTKREVSYAKRQMTWFKKQPGIIWYDELVDKIALAGELSKQLLKND